jgi:hypothetical protein
MSKQSEKHNASIVIIVEELQNTSGSYALLKTLVAVPIDDGTKLLATCAKKMVEIQCWLNKLKGQKTKLFFNIKS